MDGTVWAGNLTTGGDYRALFDQSAIPLALIAKGSEPCFVAVSRGFLETFDLKRRAVVDRPLGEVLTPKSGAELATAISHCIVTSEVVRTTLELQGAGSRCVTEAAVHAIHARGFADHVILEIEGRGHAVHSPEQRLSSLLAKNGGPGQSMTYVHNLRSHRVRYVEGELARRIGFSGGAIDVSEFLARIHPDDLGNQAAFEETREALRDGEFATQTVRVRDGQGEWLLIHIRSSVITRSRSGAARLMVGVATDITDYAAAAVQAAGVSVLHAEENERARIGRELHDSTFQHLVAADLGLSLVLRNEALSADERERLQGVQSSLAAAQTEMRAFAYFLHPPELRELGLQRALEKFCAGFARRSGLEITFTSDGVPKDLSSDAEHALFRVGQEALMNVYRHAFARQVSVGLRSKDGDLTLEVRDDGIGVDGAERFEHGGMGVAAMKSRMLSVDGELNLDYLGPGLAVIARVPAPGATPVEAAVQHRNRDGSRVAASWARARRRMELGEVPRRCADG
jgi:signal transduction histidine kinase